MNNIGMDVDQLEEEKQGLLVKAVSEDDFRINAINHQLELYTENTAQLIDLSVLFAEYPVVTASDDKGIDLERILSVARRDWGLWRTLRRNLIALERFVPKTFTQSENAEVAEIILERTAMLRSALSALSKTTIKWKADSVLHRAICEKCCSVGYPVEEARNDVWQRTETIENNNGQVRQ
jgi:hypothetical protein